MKTEPVLFNWTRSIYQCWGSVTFWCGSGRIKNIGVDSEHWYIYIILQKIKSHKEVTKQYQIKVFLTIFAWWKDPDPDPYLWLTDPNTNPGALNIRIRSPNTAIYLKHLSQLESGLGPQFGKLGSSAWREKPGYLSANAEWGFKSWFIGTVRYRYR
jgi:hypothetical protein